MQGWLEYSVFNGSNAWQDAVDTFLKSVFCYNIFCPKLTSVGDMGSKLKLLIWDIRILKTTTTVESMNDFDGMNIFQEPLKIYCKLLPRNKYLP